MTPWHKFFPRDFFDATITMDGETKAYYALVLHLIYMQDGLLHDEPRYIAGHLGVSVRKWGSIRDKLLSVGKIEIIDGIIRNPRADIVLAERAEKSRQAAENARLSGDYRPDSARLSGRDSEIIQPSQKDNHAEKETKLNENNEIAKADAPRARGGEDSDIETERKNTPPVGPPQVGGKKIAPDGVPDQNPIKNNPAQSADQNTALTPQESAIPIDPDGGNPVQTGDQTGKPIKKTDKRGTRIPPDWQPDDWPIQSLGWTAHQRDFEADSFRDYWVSRAGPLGVKLDWTATWRNWCRRAKPQHHGTGPSRHRSAVEHAEEVYQRGLAGMRADEAAQWRAIDGTGPPVEPPMDDYPPHLLIEGDCHESD